MDTTLNEGRTMRTRRVGQAVALLVAPWAFVLANAGYAWMTRHGGSDESAKGALQLSAAHPSLDKWGNLAAMVGCVLMIPAVLGAMSLVRERAARLGLLAGVLMIAGYVCYFGLCFQNYATIAMAEHGGATSDHVALVNATMNQAFFVVPALVFVAGNIIGTFLLGLAVIRARVVPRWAGICILAWPVLHIVGGTWGEVVGAVLQAIGLAVVGLQLLRSPEARAADIPEEMTYIAPHTA
jgi:hypothetical protein